MSKLLINVLAQWRAIVLVLAVVVGWVYVQTLHNTIDSQQSTLAKLSVENDVLKGNNKVLEASISANNQAISKLSESATTINKAFASLDKSVKGQVTSLDARLKDILADKQPASCEETMQYLIDAIPEYRK